MKNKAEVLFLEADILNIEMAKPLWYKGFCSTDYAKKIEVRWKKKTLSQDTIDKLIEFFKYEVAIKPVAALYRKLEIRRFQVGTKKKIIATVGAISEQEAREIVAKQEYGETEIFFDPFENESVPMWEYCASRFIVKELL